MHIVATMADGSTHETETALFMCLADRFAFREHFGRNWNAIRARYLVGTPNYLTDETLAEEFDEVWNTFFYWRCLARNGYGGSFEVFLTDVLQVDMVEQEADESEGTEKAEPEGTKEEEPDPTESPGETSTETTSSSPISSLRSA
jgi:hypothetical protein